MAHSPATDRDSGEVLLDGVFEEAAADLVDHAPTADDPLWCPLCDEPRPCNRYGGALMLLDHPRRRRHPNG